MEFINWTEELSVGVEKFDEEHKNLVNFANKLNHAIQAGEAKKTMAGILDNLVKYTAIHFTHEEEYMKIHDYPDFENHKEEHEKLKAQVGDFIDRINSGKAAFSLELMKFLNDWLVNHIKGTDMKYKDFFTSKGV